MQQGVGDKVSQGGQQVLHGVCVQGWRGRAAPGVICFKLKYNTGVP